MPTQTLPESSAPGEFEDFGLTHTKKPQVEPPQPVFIHVGTVEVTDLAHLDVEKELLEQFRVGKALLSAVINEDTNGGQKAQVYNSVNSTLSQITANRTKLYDSERVKKLEQALVKTLQAFPDMHAKFMQAYAEALKDD